MLGCKCLWKTPHICWLLRLENLINSDIDLKKIQYTDSANAWHKSVVWSLNPSKKTDSVE